MAARTNTAVHRPRAPENSVLYEAIRRHYLTFKAEVDATDRGPLRESKVG
jgi:hypothetical protein